MAENNNVYKMIQDLAEKSVDIFALKTKVNDALDTKAAAADLTALQETVGNKAAIDDVYTKTEVDSKLAGKANSAGLSVYLTEANAEATYATKEELQTLDNKKAEINPLSPYLTEAGAELLYVSKEDLTRAGYAAAADVYSKTEVDSKLDDKANVNPLSPYLTEAGAEATYAAKEDVYDKATVDTNIEAAVANKTNYVEEGYNGKALIFNEVDGGGAKYEHKDGTWSFVGVNDGGKDGINGQIYAVDSSGSGTKNGARIDITRNGMYYTVGNEGYAARLTESNEIATKGDVEAVKNLIGELPDGVTSIKDYIDSLINNNGN